MDTNGKLLGIALFSQTKVYFDFCIITCIFRFFEYCGFLMDFNLNTSQNNFIGKLEHLRFEIYFINIFYNLNITKLTKTMYF